MHTKRYSGGDVAAAVNDIADEDEDGEEDEEEEDDDLSPRHASTSGAATTTSSRGGTTKGTLVTHVWHYLRYYLHLSVAVASSLVLGGMSGGFPTTGLPPVHSDHQHHSQQNMLICVF
jgi:hypothetical protein